MNMAEAYKDVVDTLDAFSRGSRIRQRNEMLLDCMQESCMSILVCDTDGIEFPDGSIYLGDFDRTFVCFTDAKAFEEETIANGEGV